MRFGLEARSAGREYLQVQVLGLPHRTDHTPLHPRGAVPRCVVPRSARRRRQPSPQCTTVVRKGTAVQQRLPARHTRVMRPQLDHRRAVNSGRSLPLCARPHIGCNPPLVQPRSQVGRLDQMRDLDFEGSPVRTEHGSICIRIIRAARVLLYCNTTVRALRCTGPLQDGVAAPEPAVPR